MKVLLVNKFFYNGSGADRVFLNTGRLLQERGHEVSYFSMRHPSNQPSEFDPYFVSCVDFNKPRRRHAVGDAMRVLYSFEARRKLDALITRYKPDIAHLHNIYHQLSPSVLHTLAARRVPAVMTLHDFKMVCPAYTLMRGGRECRGCAHGRFYRCAVHKCLKDSFAKSALAVLEMYLHRSVLNTFKLVDCFIAPSAFLQEAVRDMGFSGEVVRLENFFPPVQEAGVFNGQQDTIVYFGRLAEGKGLFTLCEAVRHLDGVLLEVFGDGPLGAQLKAFSAQHGIRNIVFRGHRQTKEVFEAVGRSRLVVFPSECPENNPLSVIESGALGKPVIAARAGGVPELITDGFNGYLFEPGNPVRLARLIAQALGNKDRLIEMGRNARRFIQEKFNEERHYERLLGIYRRVIEKHR